MPGHVLGYDQETGFGLVQALARLDARCCRSASRARRRSASAWWSAAPAGAPVRSPARIAAKQEFAGYWEYVLDEAIFTAPAHPNWGGTAVIGPAGDLIGIGSLQLEQARETGPDEHLNMIVPIDLLKPILDDLLRSAGPTARRGPGSASMPPRSRTRWSMVGLASRGPAQRADLRTGDIVLAVGGTEVSDLAGLFRRIWSLGKPASRCR